MFSYIGSKWSLAKRYGRPEHSIVIEPFAGSACYSLYWNVPKAILFDVNEYVVGVWRYLISARSEEILSLPIDFETVDDLNICQEAKWLIGFWLNRGKSEPSKTRSAWGKQYRHSGDCKVWAESARLRISQQVERIRAWEIYQTSYEDAPDISATWFIDPPYQTRGMHCYRNSEVDFGALSDFCKERKGQVMVCETQGANWLPFTSFHDARGMKGARRTGRSLEVIYRNA